MHAQHQQVDACMSHEHGHRDWWWQVVNDICLHSSCHVAYCILSLLTLLLRRCRMESVLHSRPRPCEFATSQHSLLISCSMSVCLPKSDSTPKISTVREESPDRRSAASTLSAIQYRASHIASHEHHLQSRTHIYRAVQQDAVQQPQGPVGHSCCPAGSCQCAGHSRPNSPTAAYSTARCTQ